MMQRLTDFDETAPIYLNADFHLNRFSNFGKDVRIAHRNKITRSNFLGSIITCYLHFYTSDKKIAIHISFRL